MSVIPNLQNHVLLTRNSEHVVIDLFHRDINRAGCGQKPTKRLVMFLLLFQAALCPTDTWFYLFQLAMIFHFSFVYPHPL